MNNSPSARMLIAALVCCLFLSSLYGQPIAPQPPGAQMSIDELIAKIEDPAIAGQLKYRYLGRMSPPGAPSKGEIMAKLKVALNDAATPERKLALNLALAFGEYFIDQRNYQAFEPYFKNAIAVYDVWPEDQLELRRSVAMDLLAIGSQVYGYKAFTEEYCNEIVDAFIVEEQWVPENFLVLFRLCARKWRITAHNVKKYTTKSMEAYRDSPVKIKRLADVYLACDLHDEALGLYGGLLSNRIDEQLRQETQAAVLRLHAEAKQWDQVDMKTQAYVNQIREVNHLKSAIKEKLSKNVSLDELKDEIALTTYTPETNNWTAEDLKEWAESTVRTDSAYKSALLAGFAAMDYSTQSVKEKEEENTGAGYGPRYYQARKNLEKLIPLYVEANPGHFDRLIIAHHMTANKFYDQVEELLAPLPDAFNEGMENPEKAMVYAKWITLELLARKQDKDQAAYRENIRTHFQEALPWARQFEWFVPFYQRADMIVRFGAK